MRHSYQATLGACFTGYIVQSVINLFAPCFFLPSSGSSPSLWTRLPC